MTRLERLRTQADAGLATLARLDKRRLIMLLVAISIAWLSMMALVVRLARSRGPVDPPIQDGSISAELTLVDNRDFLVGLSIRVTGHDGKVLDGLEAINIEVAEDGRPVAVEQFKGAGQQPIRVALTIDHSGSMKDQGRMEGAKEAALALLAVMRDGSDQLAINAFDNTVTPLLGLSLLNPTVRSDAAEKIRSLKPAGGTFLFDALEKTLDGMRLATGQRIILALTDGVDSSKQPRVDAIVGLARELGIKLYTIGLGEPLGVDQPTLRALAEGSGGRYFSAPTASELAGLFRSIGQSLQDEYSLFYRSPNPVLDGQRREVSVAVRRGPVGAIASSGYSVGGVVSGGGSSSSGMSKEGSTPESDGGSGSALGVFVAVFLPWLAVLAALFAVPYWRLVHQGSGLSSAVPPVPPTPIPTPSPTLPPSPSGPLGKPVSPSSTPSARPVSAGGCPQCGRISPGSTGNRYCLVCDITY